MSYPVAAALDSLLDAYKSNLTASVDGESPMESLVTTRGQLKTKNNKRVRFKEPLKQQQKSPRTEF